ncbi:MAG: hypothetical protein F8N37_08915 [Telmatospirillum sp.]|nr:hypothetical protein [Telmatospirillum sp.]
MKSILSSAIILLALAGCVDAPIDAPSRPDDVAPPPPPEKGRGEWLIGRMKALADAGVLLEPDRVARMLSLNLKENPAETKTKSSDCANPYDSSWEISNYAPQEPNWYVGTPEGVPHMLRPGFAINPPAVMGDPKLNYTLTRIKSCTGRSEPKEYTEARLDFSYTSGYACITPPMLGKVLPEAKYSQATDGVMPYYYTGKFDDVSKATVEFHFFVGTQCLIGATVRQSEKSGKRFLRAQSRFQKCKRQADHEFCESHEPFSWSEGDKINAMNDFAAQRCGTVDSYFQKEPLSGGDPEPLPRWNYPKTPCDGR